MWSGDINVSRYSVIIFPSTNSLPNMHCTRFHINDAIGYRVSHDQSWPDKFWFYTEHMMWDCEGDQSHFWNSYHIILHNYIIITMIYIVLFGIFLRLKAQGHCLLLLKGKSAVWSLFKMNLFCSMSKKKIKKIRVTLAWKNMSFPLKFHFKKVLWKVSLLSRNPSVFV